MFYKVINVVVNSGSSVLGNISIEAAINWVADHEDDPDVDEMPLVGFNFIMLMAVMGY